MPHQLYFNLLLIAVGIFILIKSSVYSMRALVKISRLLNISEFVIAFILMAIATSLPELSVGINSALIGKPLLSLGNILGANIIVLSFVLGLVALISGQVPLKEEHLAHSSWLNFFLAASPVILLFDGELSRWDGLILIILFVLNLGRLFRFRALFHHKKHLLPSLIERPGPFPHWSLAVKSFFKNLSIFIGAVILLLTSAYLVVQAAKEISIALKIDEILVGIFIVALGTTLPELFFSVRAAIKKHEELSLGTLFGSVVFNSTLILGLVSLISPIKIQEWISYIISAATMILVVFLANLFLKTRKSLSRKEGLILIGIYILFVILQIIRP